MTEEEEQQIKNEDTSILPGRFQEKSQLQELNQRYSNYVQLMRKKRNEEVSFLYYILEIFFCYFRK